VRQHGSEPLELQVLAVVDRVILEPHLQLPCCLRLHNPALHIGCSNATGTARHKHVSSSVIGMIVIMIMIMIIIMFMMTVVIISIIIVIIIIIITTI
jgi:hypothetical protein